MPNFSNGRGPSLWWMALLLIPFAGALGAPLLDRPDPEGWGPSYFVCYELLWIALSTLALGIAYSRMTARRRTVRQEHGG
jgi:hypothetical protein